ncbi:MAG: DUF1127 domain-containing protein [Rhizobiaceae bacterium]|nr:DUF1127 domain-containing protein [Rhizobiaceae bacterium]
MSLIDHYDIITGKAQSSRILRLRRWPGALLRAVHWFEGHLAKQRSRRALGDLEDHMLRDIGISRQDAIAESRKGIFE